VVGETSIMAVPAKAISPRLIPGVNSSANVLAAACAAAIRVGCTSVAVIDGDTSITSITTARLRGMRLSAVGPASAIVSISSAITARTAGRCRHRLDLSGATVSSNSVFAKRSMRRCRDRWTMRYPPTRPKMTTRKRKAHQVTKPDSDNAPTTGTFINAPLRHTAQHAAAQMF